ncbi:MAG: hypothetical protein HFI33_11050 [Lachnospiraceae bacterium]|nr:hypothetical protein [Lachnospiraceae bacterium]
MEKIGNTQVQASAAPKGTFRQAQSTVSDSSGDFLKLLQQKTEAPKKPEDSTNSESTKKMTQEKPDKTEETVKEPKAEEPKLEEDLQQLEAQQSILMQAAVQLVNPEQQIPEQAAQPVVVEAVATELEAVMEPGAELGAVMEQPKMEVPKSQMPVETVETTEQAYAPVEVQVAEPVKSGGQEEAKSGEQPRKAPEVQETQRREPAQKIGEAAQETAALNGDERPLVSAPTNQEVRIEDGPQTGYRTQENTVKSTVENLPGEIGKAFAARGAGEAQTLTVELEPASLGKLAIRLTYETGKAVVSIMATNPRTAELLNEKASEIAAILKERTGEETMIYTQQPEREPGQDAQEQNGQGGGQQQERQQSREEKQEHTESFMQQLRLGLV